METFPELLCHPQMTYLTQTLAKNDVERFTVFMSRFGLKELIRDLKCDSVPESEDCHTFESGRANYFHRYFESSIPSNSGIPLTKTSGS
jgi:hypothetical protein